MSEPPLSDVDAVLDNSLDAFHVFRTSFCALAELLERAGVIDQDELVAELERVRPADDQVVMKQYHKEVMRSLSERVFRSQPLQFGVIEGGKGVD